MRQLLPTVTLALVMLLLHVAPARAQCYRPTYYPTYYPPPVTVVREYIKEYVPVSVVAYVAAYPTGYVPPVPVPVAPPPAAPAPPPTQTSGVSNEQILQAVLALDKRVGALEKGSGVPDPVPPPVPKEARRAANLTTLQSCAKCHTEGKLFSDGQGRSTSFVMFKADGSRSDWGDRDIRKISSQLRQQKMPLNPTTLKPEPLSNEDYADVQDALDAMKPTH